MISDDAYRQAWLALEKAALSRWNLAADEFNQWDELGKDEKLKLMIETCDFVRVSLYGERQLISTSPFRNQTGKGAKAL